MHRKIDDKDKEAMKARDDAAKKMSDMQKDCNERYHNNEIKTLSKDFGDLKGNMQKLIT